MPTLHYSIDRPKDKPALLKAEMHFHDTKVAEIVIVQGESFASRGATVSSLQRRIVAGLDVMFKREHNKLTGKRAPVKCGVGKVDDPNCLEFPPFTVYDSRDGLINKVEVGDPGYYYICDEHAYLIEAFTQ